MFFGRRYKNTAHTFVLRLLLNLLFTELIVLWIRSGQLSNWTSFKLRWRSLKQFCKKRAAAEHPAVKLLLSNVCHRTRLPFQTNCRSLSLRKSAVLRRGNPSESSEPLGSLFPYLGHFLFLDSNIPHPLAKVNSFEHKILHIFCALFLFTFNIDFLHKI